MGIETNKYGIRVKNGKEFEEPQWGLKPDTLTSICHINRFEEPQWGLKLSSQQYYLYGLLDSKNPNGD